MTWTDLALCFATSAVFFWLGFRAGHQASDKGWMELGRQAAAASEKAKAKARHQLHQANRKRGVRPPQ
jgi:hypothetical protein